MRIYSNRPQPSGTQCYCGSTDVEFCADCRGWLVENSARIEAQWQVLLKWWGNGYQVDTITTADTAEGFYRHMYLSWRNKDAR